MTGVDENDAVGIVVDLRAVEHTEFCSGGEGHPHNDCYCDVYWNDDQPKFPCAECLKKRTMPPGPEQGGDGR